jgi:hypothetical protein
LSPRIISAVTTTTVKQVGEAAMLEAAVVQIVVPFFLLSLFIFVLGSY